MSSPYPVYLKTNSVYEFHLVGGEVRTERLLWVDCDSDSVILIEVFGKRACEHRMSRKDLQESIAAGTVKELEHDPFGDLANPNHCFSDARLRERDVRVKALAPYLSAADKDRFNPETRVQLIRAIYDADAGSAPIGKTCAYALVRLYLQRGQVENALLSDRGNAGYTRARRRERPPRRRAGRSYKSLVAPRAGLVMSEELSAELLPTIKTQRERRLPNGRKPKWKDVLLEVCKLHFCDHIEIIQGSIVRVPKVKTLCPTLSQIKHIYKQGSTLGEALVKREGQAAFNRRHRALIGDQRDLAYGPAKVVQIDFTVADILLRSFDRTYILGRPTIAMIWDTFSRLILGFAVAWRRESWSTASLAILNMVADKVEVCRQLGLDIEPGTWPSALFEIGLSDNGPLISYLTSNFRQSLGLQFENTASGRPDHKPIVEYGFRYINDELISRLDGAIQRGRDLRESRESLQRARATATLTLSEFTRALAAFCHYHNTSRLIHAYPLSDDMLGKVAPIPLELWNFGVMHRTGVPRQLDVEKARMHCLCRGTATVKGDGIWFQGKPYSSRRAENEGWMVKGRHAAWLLPILYHPTNLSTIYWLNPSGPTTSEPCLEPCFRIRPEGDTPSISVVEVVRAQTRQADVTRAASESELQKATRYQATLVAVQREARAATHGQRLDVAVPDDIVRRARVVEDAVAHSYAIPAVLEASRPPEMDGSDALIQGDYALLSNLLRVKDHA